MHVSPIGPHVNPELSSWILKPFQSSKTFANLQATSRAIFHIVDDPLLMAAAVIGLCNRTVDSTGMADILDADQIAELVTAEFYPEFGWVLDLSCRWHALTVEQWDVSTPRAVAVCLQSEQKEQRPFWGWNRARHSLLELAILSSRLPMLDRQVIDAERNRHQIIIEKTAGPREIVAWELLNRHLSQ